MNAIKIPHALDFMRPNRSPLSHLPNSARPSIFQVARSFGSLASNGVQQQNNTYHTKPFIRPQIQIENSSLHPFPFATFLVASAFFSTFSETDKSRMDKRLEKYGFTEKIITGDGNCLFRALSDQLFATENKHGEIRSKVVKWLQRNQNYQIDNQGTQLIHFLDSDEYQSWDHYCRCMSQDRYWGDQFVLIAAAEIYNVSINVLSSVNTPGTSNPWTEITPKQPTPQTIWLSNRHEKHFNSIYPKDKPL